MDWVLLTAKKEESVCLISFPSLGVPTWSRRVSNQCACSHWSENRSDRRGENCGRQGEVIPQGYHFAVKCRGNGVYEEKKEWSERALDKIGRGATMWGDTLTSWRPITAAITTLINPYRHLPVEMGLAIASIIGQLSKWPIFHRGQEYRRRPFIIWVLSIRSPGGLWAWHCLTLWDGQPTRLILCSIPISHYLWWRRIPFSILSCIQLLLRATCVNNTATTESWPICLC